MKKYHFLAIHLAALMLNTTSGFAQVKNEKTQ